NLPSLALFEPHVPPSPVKPGKSRQIAANETGNHARGIRQDAAPAAASWPRMTGISATRPSTCAAMSNRVTSTSPCTSRGCGGARYQIDKAATKVASTSRLARPTKQRARLASVTEIFARTRRCRALSLTGGWGVLLHEPSVAHDQGLASQRIGPECREQQRDLGYVCLCRELAVHGFPQHHVLDHFLLGDAELARLLRDLLVDERRAHVPRTDHVGADAVLATLLCNRLAQTDQAVLSGDIGFLQR